MGQHHLSRAAAVTLVAAAVSASACTPAGAAPAPTTPPPPTATAAPTDDGNLGIRLLEAPVSRRNDPRALVYIVDHVAPGTTIKRRIEISHKDGTDLMQHIPVAVYPAAASIDAKGFQFAGGRTSNDLSGWISVGRKSLSLAPADAVETDVTIKVPARAVAGERYAVIWAETRSAAPGQVTQVNRVGIRVYLDVGPGGEKPSNFDIGTVTGRRDAAGVPRLRAEIRNTGARALDMTGSVALTNGPGGVRAGPFPIAGGTTIGIRQSGAVTAALDPRLPDGPWTATVTLQSGTVKKTKTVRISFPPEPVGVSVGGEPPSRLPWFLIGGALALALLVLLLALLARRRRRKEELVPTG